MRPFDAVILCTIRYGPIVTGYTKYLMAHKKTEHKIGTLFRIFNNLLLAKYFMSKKVVRYL